MRVTRITASTITFRVKCDAWVLGHNTCPSALEGGRTEDVSCRSWWCPGAARLGRVWMRPEGVACFAGDLPEEEQKLVWATHAAPAADLFNQKVEGTAWRSKPSWYIVATKDRTVQPELQRSVAKRMGAITVETASGHVPMLSNPALVLGVIRKAENAVTSSQRR
jgi:pimeloyl-ACP methyl ester carboxylesterase